MEESDTAILFWAINDLSCGCPAVSQSVYHCSVGLCLDCLEFGFGEVCCGKDIVCTKLIDSPVEALGFCLVEVAAGDDSGEVITFLFEHLGLLFLVSWSFVRS